MVICVLMYIYTICVVFIWRSMLSFTLYRVIFTFIVNDTTRTGSWTKWLSITPCCSVNNVFPLIKLWAITELSFLRYEVQHSLTRAPLGYFLTRPTGGGAISSLPSDLRNYSTDCKNSSGIWKPWKNCRGKTNFIDLGVTSDVTGQVKVKMLDFSGLVTSASEIAMLSSNKGNESAWIVSLTFVSIIDCALWP